MGTSIPSFNRSPCTLGVHKSGFEAAISPIRSRRLRALIRHVGYGTLRRMGLMDTVYVSSNVVDAWRLHCRACGRVPGADQEWRTKSLDPCMYSYFLRYDDAGSVRLYLLDRPSDRRFWRPWNEQEIHESERMAAEGKAVFAFWVKKPGEGCFLPEAYLPQNRRQRFMGELPHQWVEIYRSCECGEFVEYWIKFCDGIAVEARPTPPQPEPGFFADAGDLGS